MRISSKVNLNVLLGLEIEFSGWKKVLKLKIKRSFEILCFILVLFFVFILKEYVFFGRSFVIVYVLL